MTTPSPSSADAAATRTSPTVSGSARRTRGSSVAAPAARATSTVASGSHPAPMFASQPSSSTVWGPASGYTVRPSKCSGAVPRGAEGR